MEKFEGIDRFKDTVELMISVLREVNVTQSDRLERICINAFELRVLSDQDFYESVSWFARKVINIASKRSLVASRKCDFVAVRYWSSVIIAVVPVLGDHTEYSICNMSKLAKVMSDGL